MERCVQLKSMEKPSAHICILADDLTSAADGAGPFVVRGIDGAVGRGVVPRQRTELVAVNLATRSVNQVIAAERMARFATELRDVPVLFKTIDSTLRGHVGAEIEAAFRGSGRRRLVLAAAFPDAGRTARAGIQLVDGVPVDRSSYAKDPVHPAQTARLADLVPPTARDVLILDAVTQSDLNAQVARIANPESCLWVGSPGLAQALAKRFGAGISPQLPSMRAKLLVVIGTANPKSRTQGALLLGRDAVTVISAPEERQSDASGLMRQVAHHAAATLETSCFGGLIATGGGTMEATLDCLEITEFNLLGEIEPGFPVGSTLFSGGPLLLGLKAGGFGDRETLLRAADLLMTNVKELQK